MYYWAFKVIGTTWLVNEEGRPIRKEDEPFVGDENEAHRQAIVREARLYMRFPQLRHRGEVKEFRV